MGARLLEKEALVQCSGGHTINRIAHDPSAKVAARVAARARRATVDWVDVGRRARPQLVRWLAARPATTVLLYLAMPHEVSVDEVAADPALAHHAWAVPRLEPGDERLTVHPLTESLERHPYGFRQPRADAPVVADSAVGIAVVPGLAFDRWGGRLGHGEGHYDRFLPRLAPSAVLVGATADALVLDARLPADPHDVAVDWLATESGVHPVRRGF